jgi:hypothetical protein
MTSKQESNMDIFRQSIAIEKVRPLGSKKITAVQAVIRKLRDTIASDGTAYTMDYGIEQILLEIRFDTPKLSKSKAVIDAIHTCSGLYPQATFVCEL